MSKINIDFSEVTEINNSNNDSFYLDVLNDSFSKSLYKLNKEIDLYFFEEFYMERKELRNNEFYSIELDRIIKYIDDVNIAGHKNNNKMELIEQKNEILTLLDIEFISHNNIAKIQGKIKRMKTNDKKINFGPLNSIKLEILSQLPRIENTIKVIKHYKIIDGKAIHVPLDNFISLKRPKFDNNIYLPVTTDISRRVYKGYRLGPRAGEGFEFLYVELNKKWVIQTSKSIWIS